MIGHRLAWVWSSVIAGVPPRIAGRLCVDEMVAVGMGFGHNDAERSKRSAARVAACDFAPESPLESHGIPRNHCFSELMIVDFAPPSSQLETGAIHESADGASPCQRANLVHRNRPAGRFVSG